MKLSYLLIFIPIFCLLQNGMSQNVRITLNLENVSVKEVLDEVEKQGGIKFLYRTDQVDVDKRLSINVQDATIEHILGLVFSKENVAYKFFNNNLVVIGEKGVQPKTIIRGVVEASKEGVPLEAVSIVEKGAGRYAISDSNGQFSIETTSPTPTLIFSFIGYTTQEVVANPEIPLTVKLAEDVLNLEGVVITGYSSTKRKEITGSVVSFRPKEKFSGTHTSADKMLAGKAGGINISQTSGAPGSGAKVFIRGITSIKGCNQPLYVIDNVPIFTARNDQISYSTYSNNPLLCLSPDDIESIDVLKDASSTAIYGSRGANGVIIINTKRGQKNEPLKITIDCSVAAQQPINTVKVLNASQWREYMIEVATHTINAYNDGNINLLEASLDPGAFGGGVGIAGQILNITPNADQSHFAINGVNENFFGNNNTNWQDEIMRNNPLTSRVNVSIEGGSDIASYSTSINYINQNGLILNSSLKRYSVRQTIDIKLHKNLDFGLSANYSFNNIEGINDMASNSPLIIAVGARPDYGVRNSKNEFVRLPYDTRWTQPNPVACLEAKPVSKNNNLLLNGFLKLKIAEGLVLRSDISIGLLNSKVTDFKPMVSVYYKDKNDRLNRTLDIENSQNLSTTFDNYLNFNRVFGSHSITAMCGLSFNKDVFGIEAISAMGFPDDNIQTNLGSADRIRGGRSDMVISGLNSYFARTSYSYVGKYVITGTARLDGSSKFGPNNKWGFFPSIAGAWNIHEEGFMEQLPWISNLKLMVSYGRTGMANVDDYLYNLYFARLSGYSYNAITALYPTGVPNKNIGWQSTNEFNTGLDFAIFDNRIFGGIEVYHRYSKGDIMPTFIAPETGTSVQQSNLADVSNKGWEVRLGAHIINSPHADGFNWLVDFNIAGNVNRIEHLQNADLGEYSDVREGWPIGAIQGYKVEGIFQNQSQVDNLNMLSPTGIYISTTTGPGDYIYQDTNKDGVITDADRVLLGSINPKFYGGFSTEITYRRFDISAMLQFSYGAKKEMESWSNLVSGVSHQSNSPIFVAYDHWTPERPNATYSRMIFSNPGENFRINERKVREVSYLRVQEIRLGYTLPSIKIIRNARIYVAVTNLFTLTKYPAGDPETTGDRKETRSGTMEYQPYPMARTFAMGMMLKF